jgi:hypothetical protein
MQEEGKLRARQAECLQCARPMLRLVEHARGEGGGQRAAGGGGGGQGGGSGGVEQRLEVVVGPQSPHQSAAIRRAYHTLHHLLVLQSS